MYNSLIALKVRGGFSWGGGFHGKNSLTSRAAMFKRINGHVWFKTNKRFTISVNIFMVFNVPVSMKQNKLILDGQLTMYER